MRDRFGWMPLAAMALGGAVLLAGCGDRTAGKTAAAAAGSPGASHATVTRTFGVQGMTCTGCEAAVRASVKTIPGVETASADYKKGEATVVYDPKKVSEGRIAKVIEKAGYTVERGAPSVGAGPGRSSGTNGRP